MIHFPHGCVPREKLVSVMVRFCPITRIAIQFKAKKNMPSGMLRNSTFPTKQLAVSIITKYARPKNVCAVDKNFQKMPTARSMKKENTLPAAQTASMI